MGPMAESVRKTRARDACLRRVQTARAALLVGGLFALVPVLHAQQVPWRLDHANIVVRDLEAAQREFEQLGFVIKTGRPHDNSIQNLHLKFLDGTELELITATEPRDSLAMRYLSLLEQGEGGAFFAMRADTIGRLERSVRRWNLRELFVTTFQQSPTDSAHHFQHPNTAYTLQAVWLAVDTSDRANFTRFGLVPVAPDDTPQPRQGNSRAATFEGGSMLYLLPRVSTDTWATRIVGVTILVGNAAQAAELIGARRSEPMVVRDSHRGRSLMVYTHGIWIELLEPRVRR